VTQTLKTITLVTGVPRSGASLLTRFLEAGGMPVYRAKAGQPGSVESGDGESIPMERHVRVTEGGMVPAINGAVRIDHDLLYALPACFQYRMILMRRELEEIAALQATAIGHLGGGPHVTSERLMARLRRQERFISDWLEHRPQLKVLEVSHAEIQERTPAAVIAIDQFFGGGLDRDAMRG